MVGAGEEDLRERMWEWMLERSINKDVRALWQVCMRIKDSPGAHRSAWPGGSSASESGRCGVRRRPAARAPNKGFARRPQEFLAWGE